MTTEASPHTLLDDGYAPASCAVLVIGCGNILRGDDAVGPILIRRLWEDGVPDDVRIVDGGTAGMDVAFQMRGARRVVIVDAASTGGEPGTMYRVPAEELADTGPVDGVHTHSFRWDHALRFSRWLLGPECPSDVTVFLIEAQDLTPGAELSEPVRVGMERTLDLVRQEFFPQFAQVEITDSGHLRISAATANRYFPSDACGLTAHTKEGNRELHLIPLHSTANGGQLLKQRNRAGDRVLLVREALDDDLPVGNFSAHWDHTRGALVVDLHTVDSEPRGRGE